MIFCCLIWFIFVYSFQVIKISSSPQVFMIASRPADSSTGINGYLPPSRSVNPADIAGTETGSRPSKGSMTSLKVNFKNFH